MSLRWKMQTNFPFSRMFVLGIILFFFGLASMVISVISFITQSWGHYVGTGMWGGSMILISGMAAVFASRLKSQISVRTLCLCAVAAACSSLAMLVLSAGGLTLSSGFYSRIDSSDYNKRTSNLVHASLLVISVFCLSGNVLAVIVCCKYLFFEHKNKSKHRRRYHHGLLREGSERTTTTLRGGGAPNTSRFRSSTDSRTPLQIGDRRNSDHVDINHVQLEYRRSHRRTASDQAHAAHSRRQRHCQSHMEVSHSPNRLNVLSPEAVSVRYNAEKRRAMRSSGHQLLREARPSSKERERLNIVPVRNAPCHPRPMSHPLLHSCLPVRGTSSGQPKVRLPTDFDEEELPPYEPAEAPRTRNAHNVSMMDSGDESDTENSSTTEAQSYDASGMFGRDGVEAVAMVDLSQQNNPSNHNPPTIESLAVLEQTTSFTSSPAHHSQKPADISSGSTVRPASLPVTVDGEEVNLISVNAAAGDSRDPSRRDRCMLRFATSSRPDDPTGDYERLLSVSPEVCAINGESPDPVQDEDVHVPHKSNENFYENGPCYENFQRIGQPSRLNPLSKTSPSLGPSSVNQTRNTELEGAVGGANPEGNETSAAKCSVSAQVLAHPTPHVLVSSPKSPQNSFSSTFSAFKPVSPSSPMSPPQCATSQPVSVPSNVTPNISQNTTVTNPTNDCSQSPTTIEAAAVLARRYEEQGAKPKTFRGGNPLELPAPKGRDGVHMSWKNIPLPHSYNHTDCASHEPEDKLPSKTIPFTDHCDDQRLMARSPSSNLVPGLENSPPSTNAFGAAAKAILSPAGECKSTSLSATAGTTANGLSNNSKRQVSSFKEASTQVSSVSSAALHSGPRRCQSLGQSKRPEAVCSNHLKQGGGSSDARGRNRQSSSTQTVLKPGLAIGTVAIRTTRLTPGLSSAMSSSSSSPHRLAMSGDRVESQRSTRPSALNLLTSSTPATTSSGSSAISGVGSSRLVSLLSSQRLSSARHGQGQPSSLFLRQSGSFVQPYPLQPQQPRLGVGVHQRRQQQHQLQQNIESLQHQRHQQQVEQQRQQAQFGENAEQNPRLQAEQRPLPYGQHQAMGAEEQPRPIQEANIENPNDRELLRNGRPLFSVLL